MSANTKTLSHKTIQAWRDFAGTTEFQAGIDYLRHNEAPKCGGNDEVTLLKSALSWGSYHQALTDIEDKLTEIPKLDRSPEEPGLNA